MLSDVSRLPARLTGPVAPVSPVSPLGPVISLKFMTADELAPLKIISL